MNTKALIIVDAQNDFFPGGSLGVEDGHAIVPLLNALIKHAKENDWLVIMTRDWHPEKTAHFEKWPVHCVANTPGAAFHPDLVLPEGYICISKGLGTKDDGYSPFEGVTEQEEISLDDLLKVFDITELYIAGLATDFCVKACVLDACRLGYSTTLVADAIRAVNIHPTDGVEALQAMQAAGAHVTKTMEVLNNEQQTV